jgi:hypothetical protein
VLRVLINDESPVTGHVRTVTEHDEVDRPLVRYLPRPGNDLNERPLAEAKEPEQLRYVIGGIEVTVRAREHDVEVKLHELPPARLAFAA